MSDIECNAMERKLDVGSTLSEVFDTYRDQAGVLLPVAFWLFLIVAIVNGLTAGDFSLFWVALIVSLAVGTLYQGMVVNLVNDLQDGRRDSSVGDLMRSALPFLAPLIGAGILEGTASPSAPSPTRGIGLGTTSENILSAKHVFRGSAGLCTASASAPAAEP